MTTMLACTKIEVTNGSTFCTQGNCQKLNGTAVVVSHDLESIYLMADYIAMLFEGAIVAYGTVDEIQRSPNPIVQQFLQGSEVGPIPI